MDIDQTPPEELQPPIDPQPEPEPTSGVFVVVAYDEAGNARVEATVPQGNTRPSEISDLLGLALKTHRLKNGIS